MPKIINYNNSLKMNPDEYNINYTLQCKNKVIFLSISFALEKFGRSRGINSESVG
jgi:hypothetical protein